MAKAARTPLSRERAANNLRAQLESVASCAREAQGYLHDAERMIQPTNALDTVVAYLEDMQDNLSYAKEMTEILYQHNAKAKG